MIVEQRNCIYCDSDSSLVKEHVIPASFFGFRCEDRDRQWIVTGCETCNILAGSFTCFSIPEKASYILKRYRVRYKKIIETPHWNEEELNGLDYNLRNSIVGALQAKSIIGIKLRHLESVSNYEVDYLRPHWVELWMKEEKKKNRNRKRKTRKNIFNIK